jgi:hypothetical protein
MGARESLHRLIDDLPEDDLPAAERALLTLHTPAQVPLERAPLDDEPDDDDFDGGLAEARADVLAGRVVSLEEDLGEDLVLADSSSGDLLSRLAEEALAEDRAGLTQDLDPDQL